MQGSGSEAKKLDQKKGTAEAMVDELRADSAVRTKSRFEFTAMSQSRE